MVGADAVAVVIVDDQGSSVRECSVFVPLRCSSSNASLDNAAGSPVVGATDYDPAANRLLVGLSDQPGDDTERIAVLNGSGTVVRVFELDQPALMARFIPGDATWCCCGGIDHSSVCLT